MRELIIKLLRNACDDATPACVISSKMKVAMNGNIYDTNVA